MRSPKIELFNLINTIYFKEENNNNKYILSHLHTFQPNFKLNKSNRMESIPNQETHIIDPLLGYNVSKRLRNLQESTIFSTEINKHLISSMQNIPLPNEKNIYGIETLQSITFIQNYNKYDYILNTEERRSVITQYKPVSGYLSGILFSADIKITDLITDNHKLELEISPEYFLNLYRGEVIKENQIENLSDTKNYITFQTIQFIQNLTQLKKTAGFLKQIENK